MRYQYIINPASKVITTESRDADDFYGLVPGTNGTAATCRRALVEGTITEPATYRWVRSTGHRATGISYVPSDCSDADYSSPWGE